VSGTTVKQKLYATDKKERYFHIFYDDGRKAAERERLEYKIDRMGKKLKECMGEPIHPGGDYQKYFDLIFWHPGQADEKFMSGRERTDVINREIQLCGYFAIVTSEKMTAEEALTLYKSRDDSEKTFNLGHGHQEVYAVEHKASSGSPERNIQATKYFRVNPHRLNLGTIGLDLKDSQGALLPLTSLKSPHQSLHLWDGEIESDFKVDDEPVEVTTGVHPTKDAIYARIQTNLLKDRRATVALRFSYPTGNHSDDANDWTKPERHQSVITSQDDHSAIIERTVDDTKYYVLLQWEGPAVLQECDRHHFELSTSDNVLTFAAEYLPNLPNHPNLPNRPNIPIYEYDQYHKITQRHWHQWWNSGAIVDFSRCTDPRSKELERRVVLSQYLTQINCANNMPPQETGLTYNSWFGRPHLEMTWWHAVDFALCNRPEVLEQILRWYNETAYPVARQIATR
jgi:hypothetical protein